MPPEKLQAIDIYHFNDNELSRTPISSNFTPLQLTQPYPLWVGGVSASRAAVKDLSLIILCARLDYGSLLFWELQVLIPHNEESYVRIIDVHYCCSRGAHLIIKTGSTDAILDQLLPH